MIFFATSKKTTGALVALIGLTACQMPNPAFEGDGADEVGDDLDTTADDSEASESAESGESSSDTNDTSDNTDVVDTADLSDQSTSDDMPEPDLPDDQTCNAAFSEPLSVIYGTPEAFEGQVCKPALTQHLKVLGAGPVDGLIMAEVCAPGCSSCFDEIIPVGVLGLSDFSAPLIDQVQNQQQFVCIRVETGPFRGLAESRCLYDSMWVGDAESDLMIAQHRVSQLPPAATLAMGNKPAPVPGEMQIHCSCDALYDPISPNLACCLDQISLPYVSSVVYLGFEYGPGSGTPLVLEGANWTFHVAQAQWAPSCENNPALFEMSWALVVQ